ncbi:hypothetical protein BDR05DRAFT_953331 [Suillus weaverae]|nr:hypothetical protein BDR05DRAFT_953331 [Suillus weaverae]
MSLFELSNILGAQILDAYIVLIATQRLQTECRGALYRGKAGGNFVQAPVQLHWWGWHKACHCRANPLGGKEEMVSDGACLGAWAKHTIRPPSASSRQIFAPTVDSPLPCAPLACSITIREKCSAWLARNSAHNIPDAGPAIERSSPLDCSTLSVLGQSTPQEEGPASFSLNCMGPSLPLSSMWITADVQEAFYVALQMELTMQAELMVTSLATRCSNAYLCNLGLDLLILHAKIHRAQAEIALYMLAIENTPRFNLSDSKEVHHYDDIDDATDEDYEDYEDYEDHKVW